ncbi:hypothetical protein OO015_13710 (plasmid) [Thermomicrobium sp. 4228-Ro]|uniref:helix-turn-helix domain-containing protein n=1 Tax=Thermomicrobium sp. 4228-Ro TaxID=2993937 RepID=UPI002249132F|nr:helix-turn-helix domain-containing protein [Thermomicrobium sp. 4228-Ro]MCX2728541.1 hypothetical protein [Thermomicrobium sp. 4228-Ro]
MAGRPPRVSDDAIAKALEKHYGVLAHAARELGMRVDTLHRRIARSPTLQAALHEKRRSLAVKAFEKLQEHLDRGEPWAIQYVLKRVGSYVALGPPAVQVPRASDPRNVLERLDQLEHELAGYPVSVRDVLALLEFRRAAVADILRTGDIPDLDTLVTEVTHAIETAIPDPELRTRVAQALAQGLQRATGREAGA